MGLPVAGIEAAWGKAWWTIISDAAVEDTPPFTVCSRRRTSDINTSILVTSLFAWDNISDNLIVDYEIQDSEEVHFLIVLLGILAAE